MSKRFLTTAEVMYILGVCRHTLYSWVKRRAFPAGRKVFGTAIFWDFGNVKKKLKDDHERINAAWSRLREVEKRDHADIDSALLLSDSGESSE